MNPLGILLRLDSLKQDTSGWWATFYGKPDTVGNSISFPVSEEHAAEMDVGKQYLFVHDPEDIR